MSKKHKYVRYRGLPEHSWLFLLGVVLLSFLFHFLSFIQLGSHDQSRVRERLKAENKQKVKVRLISKETQPEKNKKIAETPMTPTEAPAEAQFRGAQDHKTEKETKVSHQNRLNQKGRDPGQQGTGDKISAAQQKAGSKRPKVADEKQMAKDSVKRVLTSPSSVSQVVVPNHRRMPRNAYESLMPGRSELNHQLLEGYQDYIDADIAEGDKVDLNTSDYRYIGYFTSIRKAFELVWTYPSDAARRGLQGNVTVEFTIAKDGQVKKIRIVESSGHRILDNAVVSALNLASPYAPLPQGLEKKQLTVVGSFRYVLTGLLGAH